MNSGDLEASISAKFIGTHRIEACLAVNSSFSWVQTPDPDLGQLFSERTPC